jgi:hypothetical protein
MERTSAVGPPIELPIIDISNSDDPNVGKAMLDAAAKYGFLYVDSKGTDFAAEDVNRAFELVDCPRSTVHQTHGLTEPVVESFLCLSC